MITLFRLGWPLVVFLAGAHAAFVDTTERPLEELFQSDVVFSQEEGEVQLSATPLYQHARDGSSEVVPLGVEYGLTDSWQVEAEWESFVRHQPATGPAGQGIGDLDFGSRYSWMNIAGSGLHVAMGLDVTAPLASERSGLGEGKWVATPNAVVALSIPGWSGAHAFSNFGVEWNDGHGDGPRTNWYENFGFYGPIGRFTPTFEVNLREDKDNYVTPGLVWRPYAGLD